MKRLVLLLPLLLVCFGCQDTDDGIDDNAVQTAQAPLVSAARRAGGDWEKLSAEEKKLFLDRTRGNEASAKSMVGMMAGGAPTGPPKR